MIPRDYILEWREQAPWPQDFQVEQDLIISRALVEIFLNSVLHDALAFRGGTALYKLHLKPAARYSEDIDLVQTRAGPAAASFAFRIASLGTATTLSFRRMSSQSPARIAESGIPGHPRRTSPWPMEFSAHAPPAPSFM